MKVNTKNGLNKTQGFVFSAIDAIQDTRAELEEYFDAKSDSWKDSEKGMEMEELIGNMESIENELESILSSIEDLLSE